jgi:lipid-binding SYLF domain-containing protein
MAQDLRRAAAVLAAALMMAGGAGAQQAAEEKTEAKRISEASAVFSAFMSSDKTIPRAVLDKAAAVAVFPYAVPTPSRRGQGPNTRKMAFYEGIRARGVLSVRSGSGRWSAPAFVTLKGGNRPLGDIVLVFVDRGAVDQLSGRGLPLNADGGVADAELGAAEAAADLKAGVRIISYSRSRGRSGDVPVTGSTIAYEDGAIRYFYGKPLTGADALQQADGPAPVADWRAALEKHTR